MKCDKFFSLPKIIKMKKSQKGFPLFIMAALCDVACTVDPPAFVSACVPERLKGGIVQVIFSSCDLDWDATNLADTSFWATNVANGKLSATGRVKGGGFNFTASTEETDACRPPELTGGVWSATIKDFNIVSATSSDNTNYDALVTQPNKFQVAFRTSADYLFGFYPLTISNMQATMPDDCKQLFYREVTFSWTSVLQPARKYISFLQTHFPI